MALELGYEKVFDCVNLEFLLDLLEKIYAQNGHFGCNESHKVALLLWSSIRPRSPSLQLVGDPIPPLLFNLVVDALTSMLCKDAKSDPIRDLCAHICSGGVIWLKYAYDIILFVDKVV